MGTSKQITVQGSGIFTRMTRDSGLPYKPTSSRGILVGYRYNIIRWLGVEGDFDYFRNSQKYLTSTNTDLLKANVSAVTGTAVISIPNPLIKRLHSFVQVGGGALLFSPQDMNFDNPQSINWQTKPVIVFGGGMDIDITRRIAIRGEARTLMNKAPDFGFDSLRVDKYSQTMIPSVGIVFKF
jgi:opacity protein-like surface antigen